MWHAEEVNGRTDARTNVDDAERRFVERFALVLTEAGLPRMASRVFACLLVADDGQLSAGQLAARLHVSPAAVSGAVRYLVQLNMVHREREPGASRDHYRIDDDMWYEVYMQRSAVLERWEKTLAEGVALAGTDDPARHRIVEAKEFVSFLRAELPQLMERWHDHRARLHAEPTRRRSRR
jgi:DNA-binding transcriptional regulator GbsR (MarR family)